jgi:ATP-dependent Clp protease ATP-binding subunit ClpC
MHDMQDTFQKFTKQTRNVLTLTLEEAVRLNHGHIGTEHLLLGLLRETDGVAAWALSALGITLDDARAAVEASTGRGDHQVLGEITQTPRIKRVFVLAGDEAVLLGNPLIYPQHLLLGIAREGQGVAAEVLLRLGVTLEQVRNETLRLLLR